MKVFIKLSRTVQKASKTLLSIINNFIKRNLKALSRVILLPIPLVVFYLGSVLEFNFLNCLKIIALEAFAILLSWLLSFISLELNGKMNFPESRKRFTKEDEDGEVTIETKRLQEMILWVADVEDWMERKGLR